jgi:hypothetical protein
MSLTRRGGFTRRRLLVSAIMPPEPYLKPMRIKGWDFPDKRRPAHRGPCPALLNTHWAPATSPCQREYGELRNAEYLSPDYFDLLRSHKVAHCFNAWTRMPGLGDQARLNDAYTADFTVVRALLTKGRDYEGAVDAFGPYDRLREPNEGAREGMETISWRAGPMRLAFLYVNNRLEGTAPSTIEAIAGSLGA